MITKDNLPNMTPEEETRGIACAYGPPIPLEMFMPYLEVQKPGEGQKNPPPKPVYMWICQGCGVWNTGEFCMNCGKPVPETVQKNAAPEPFPWWVCEGCGAWNTGKFCTECGKPKPEEKQTFVLRDSVPVWVCKSCGNRSIGESCAVCGKPKSV